MSFDHDRIVAGLICDKDLHKVREAVCVQTEKVYDSCKEKDCIEDAPVLFFADCPQEERWISHTIKKAINVKCRKAEILDVYTDIEPVPFKRGFYTVDIKFYIAVTLDFFVPASSGMPDIRTLTGIVLFDKKVILFGSEGNVKIFKTRFIEGDNDYPTVEQDNLPISKVEVAEPICLSARIQDLRDKLFDCCCGSDRLPNSVAAAMRKRNANTRGYDEEDEADAVSGELVELPRRRVVASIGLFSIVKLVRKVQLLIPAFDFCVPNKKCVAATEENPCELFETIDFPVDEFFPPQKFDFPGAEETEKRMLEEA
jgi:hypothetical protein